MSPIFHYIHNLSLSRKEIKKAKGEKRQQDDSMHVFGCGGEDDGLV